MQCDNDVGFFKRLVVSDLPCELVVDGFVDQYSFYLENFEGTSGPAVTVLFRLISCLIILVGGATLVLGPSTVSYSLMTGPTLMELIQMVPGPIITVGFLLLAISNAIDNQNNAPLTPEQFLLKFYEVKLADELDDSAGVSIAHMDGALFQVTRD